VRLRIIRVVLSNTAGNALRGLLYICWILLLLPASASPPAAQTAPRNILILHTYRSSAMPYGAMAATFKTALSRDYAGAVNIHEVPLDSDRFPDLQMQLDFAEFLGRRFAAHPPDLILPIGAPAGQFIARFRDTAFPGAPVIYLAVDERFLSPETLSKNATVFSQRIKPARWVQDILQIKPDTTHIAVVMGVSPLEKFWTDVLRRELQIFSNRVELKFLSGMSLDRMEKEVSALPPNSFILFGLLIEDGAGITYGGFNALERLHAIANSPIYGIFQSETGRGIIGGRLYEDQNLGIHAATAAARILRGEPVKSIPGEIVQSSSPVYDWRELKRWSISDSRLPPGSTVLFREPTLWQRYRWYITAIVLFALIETLLIIGLLTNLAKRRRMEKELRQSEQKYRRLYESMMDAFISVDMSGRIREFNPAFQKMLGYPEEELRQLTYPEITPDKWHELEERIIREQILPRGFSDIYEKEYRRKDGTVFPVELCTLLMKDDALRPHGMWAIVRDVTERKRAEAELRHRNRYIETVLEESPIGFAVHTIDDGVARFVSARFEEIYCVPRGTIDSHYTFFDKVWPYDPDLREQIRDRVVADMTSGDASRMHWENVPVRSATGEIRYIAAMNIPVPEENVVVSTVQDVTEHVRAQEALRASEKRFRQVTELVSDFVWEVDATGLYKYTSPSVEKILGYTPDELIGKKYFYELFVPDLREQLKEAAFKTFAERRSFQAFPNINISKTGKLVRLETSGMPMVDESGNLLGYRGADIDITEKHQSDMETQLLRQEMALFSRVATVNELTASLAHELNQPLAAILNNAQAALRFIERGCPDLNELKEIFKDIVADDQRAAEVIRSLRSMLKNGAAEHQTLLLNDLTADVASMVRNDAMMRKVSIALDFDSLVPLVQGDRVQLQQVILNLIFNAFESMEASDRPAKLRIQTRAVDGEAILDVADSGPGIAADKIDSIFEPFITTKNEGLGLGLALSRSIVKAHKGRLWAENNPDGGATFHVALPAAKS
jgi:PAS domain S-box-containing protein